MCVCASFWRVRLYLCEHVCVTGTARASQVVAGQFTGETGRVVHVQGDDANAQAMVVFDSGTVKDEVVRVNDIEITTLEKTALESLDGCAGAAAAVPALLCWRGGEQFCSPPFFNHFFVVCAK